MINVIILISIALIVIILFNLYLNVILKKSSNIEKNFQFIFTYFFFSTFIFVFR